MENGSLMKVENIAECSPLGAFCNAFDLQKREQTTQVMTGRGLEKGLSAYFPQGPLFMIPPLFN